MDKQSFKQKTKNMMIKVKDKVLDLLFPQNLTCDICENEMTYDTKYHVCQHCEKEYFTHGKVCSKCGSEINDKYATCFSCKDKQTFYKIARAPLVYSGEVKTAIHNFKYRNAKYLAVTFGNLMTNTIISNNFDFDIIVPVPLTKKRLKVRGYNQSLLLANQISKNLCLPVISDALVRTKFDISQTALKSEQRYQNLEDSFEVCDTPKILGKRILLIDDVMTTGATIEACSKVLMNAGANTIYVCCCTRTSSRSE